jgi:hypothetical protein
MYGGREIYLILYSTAASKVLYMIDLNGRRVFYLILYSTAANKLLYMIVSQWWKGNLSHLILDFCSQCALLDNN